MLPFASLNRLLPKIGSISFPAFKVETTPAENLLGHTVVKDQCLCSIASVEAEGSKSSQLLCNLHKRSSLFLHLPIHTHQKASILSIEVGSKEAFIPLPL